MGQRLQTKITHCVPLYFPRLYTQYESWPRRWTFKLTLWYGALALNLPWMYRSTRLVFPPYSFPRRTTFKSTFPAMAVKYGSWPWQESIQLVAVIGKRYRLPVKLDQFLPKAQKNCIIIISVESCGRVLSMWRSYETGWRRCSVIPVSSGAHLQLWAASRSTGKLRSTFLSGRDQHMTIRNIADGWLCWV